MPLTVICELLGLPPADRPKFIAWTRGFTRLTGVVGFFKVVPAMSAMKRYLEQQLHDARETGGEGLIAELVRVEQEGGRITPEEMVAMVFLLLGAGTETTTHLISGAAFELMREPRLRDWLQEDWSRANLAVEELLRSSRRFSSPSRASCATTSSLAEQLKKGEKVMAMLAAANMDPAANEHPSGST